MVEQKSTCRACNEHTERTQTTKFPGQRSGMAMLAAAARNDISQRLRIRVPAATVLNQYPRGMAALQPDLSTTVRDRIRS